MLKQLGPIFLLGIAQEFLWVWSYRYGPFRENSFPFLGLMLAGFALCLWAFFRLPLVNSPAVVSMIAFALLFRITVLPALPYQSEDIYRYLWDARLSAAGIDPFQFPPQATELEAFRDTRIYPELNSKPYITAYPPLSQLLFRLSYAFFGESVIAMKSLFSLLEFSSLLLTWKLLLDFGQRLEPLYLVAWNPFFILEFSHSGHSDSGMIFFMLLSVYLLSRSNKAWGMVSYAAAVLVKLHPALWFPLYVRRAGWKAGLAGIIAGVAVVSIYFTPASGLQYLNSLKLYFRLFEFNAGIHYLIRMIGRDAYDQSWDQLTGPYLAATLLAVSILIWWRFPLRDERDLLHAGFWLMTADVCLATTVHPWYLSWAAFVLPFFPYAFMVYWTGAAALSYLAYGYRPVYEQPWVLLAQYLPMYALMAVEIYRRGPLLPAGLKRK